MQSRNKAANNFSFLTYVCLSHHFGQTKHKVSSDSIKETLRDFTENVHGKRGIRWRTDYSQIFLTQLSNFVDVTVDMRLR